MGTSRSGVGEALPPLFRWGTGWVLVGFSGKICPAPAKAPAGQARQFSVHSTRVSFCHMAGLHGKGTLSTLSTLGTAAVDCVPTRLRPGPVALHCEIFDNSVCSHDHKALLPANAPQDVRGILRCSTSWRELCMKKLGRNKNREIALAALRDESDRALLDLIRRRWRCPSASG